MRTAPSPTARPERSKVTRDSSFPPRRLRLSPVCMLVIVAVVYGITVGVLPTGGFWINDNGCKFIEMKGLILNGYRAASIPWNGRGIDPALFFNPLPPPFGEVFEGEVYGFYSQAFAFLSSFPYRVLGARGLYVVPCVSSLLLLVAVAILAGSLPGRPRALAVAVVGLCTPVWFYSAVFWEHAPAACCVVWSVVAVVKHREGASRRNIVFGALFLGLSIYFRDNLYLMAGPVAAAAVLGRPFRWKSLLLFSATLALTLTPLWVFNWTQFGQPLGLRLVSAASADGGLVRHLADRPRVFSLLLLNGHGNVALSLVATVPFAALFFLAPKGAGPRRGLAMEGLAILGLLSGVIVTSGHLLSNRPLWWLMKANGLFAACPLLILAVARHEEEVSEKRSSGAVSTIRLIVISYVGIYALASPLANTEGIHWGCRLLLSVYPLLGVLAASAISQWCRRARRPALATTLAVALIVVSHMLQVYSLRLLYGRRSFSSYLNQLVAQRSEDIVIAQSWFVPQEIATVFYDKKVLLVRRAEHLPTLLRHLRERHIREVLLVSDTPPSMVPRSATRFVRDPQAFVSFYVTPLRL